MKCQEVCAVLEEYFDGELDERHSQTIAAHVSACADCTAQYAALQHEQDLLMRYERDVEVTPALWHGVAARIAADRAETVQPPAPLGARVRAWLAASFTVPRFSPALTAALVAVAIALTVGVMKFAGQGGDAPPSIATTKQTPQPAPSATNTEQLTAPDVSGNKSAGREQPVPQVAVVSASPEQQTVAAPKKREEKRDKTLSPNAGVRVEEARLTTPPTRREQTAEDLVKDAEQKYQKAIEILARDVKARRPRLDPETLARFDDTLKALDRTIAETRRAALGQDNDPVAVQYMLTAYAKKVEVLREMSRN